MSVLVLVTPVITFLAQLGSSALSDCFLQSNRCDCGRCSAMPTPQERFCCRELPPAVRKQPTGCITLDADFAKLCLDVAVLAVAYCELRESGRELQLELHE